MCRIMVFKYGSIEPCSPGRGIRIRPMVIKYGPLSPGEAFSPGEGMVFKYGPLKPAFPDGEVIKYGSLSPKESLRPEVEIIDFDEKQIELIIKQIEAAMKKNNSLLRKIKKSTGGIEELKQLTDELARNMAELSLLHRGLENLLIFSNKETDQGKKGKRKPTTIILYLAMSPARKRKSK